MTRPFKIKTRKILRCIYQNLKAKDKYTISILFLGLLFSFITLTINISSIGRTKALDYKLESLAHNPILKIDKVNIAECTENLNYSNMGVTVSFKFNLLIKNVGNSIASVVYSFCVNSETYENNLRKSTINSELINKALFKKKKKEDYYQRINVLPDGAKSISFESPIMFVNNDQFTIQILVYYINELGILFDTYYKFKVEKKPSRWIIEKDSLGIVINSYIEKPGDIKILDDELKYNSYSEAEKKTIFKTLNILENDKKIKAKKIHKGLYE